MAFNAEQGDGSKRNLILLPVFDEEENPSLEVFPQPTASSKWSGIVKVFVGMALIGCIGVLRLRIPTFDMHVPKEDKFLQLSLIPNASHDAGTKHRASEWKRRRFAMVHDDEAASYKKGVLGFGGGYDLATYTAPDGTMYYPWMFGKPLTHDPNTLLPSKAQADKLIAFLANPSRSGLIGLETYPGSVRKFEDVLGGYGVEPIGLDALSKIFEDVMQLSVCPARSREGFAEMMEVYAKILLRDVSFNAIAAEAAIANSLTAKVIAALNTIAASYKVNYAKPVTAQNLFRGTAKDETKGNYVSQCLILDVGQGALRFPQLYLPENDQTITKDTHLAVVQGVQVGPPDTTGRTARRLQSLRDVGSMVHKDPAYALYFNAALVLLGGGAKAGGLDTSAFPSSNFLDTGTPDILTTLASVARAALRAAWSIKWGSALKLRPEEYAARIQMAVKENSDETNAQIPGFAEVKTWSAEAGPSDILAMIETARGGDLFLNGLYKEGSPTHPAFPAGHAAVAGACCTVLKAMIKTHYKNMSKILWKDAIGPVQQVAADGSLENAAQDEDETIIGELNKLANNVALGRNMAGVHYRSDGTCGLDIGEKVAEQFLCDAARHSYPAELQEYIAFTYENFAGDFVRIDRNGINVTKCD